MHKKRNETKKKISVKVGGKGDEKVSWSKWMNGRLGIEWNWGDLTLISFFMIVAYNQGNFKPFVKRI